MTATILLVGHCGPDAYALKSAVGRIAPGSEIVFVHDRKSLEQMATKADLLLVNRVLEVGFETSSGLDLITQIRKAPDAPRCMLISNLPEAQAAAEAAGAIPGFGKSQMYADETIRRIRAALEPAPADDAARGA